MGNYLRIGNYETNSKCTSSILSTIINDMYEVLGADNKVIVYMKDENSYVLKKKGVSYLCKYVERIIGSDEWVTDYTYEHNIYHDYNGDKGSFYSYLIEMNKNILKNLQHKLYEVLCDMVFYKIKSVETEWY